MLKLICTCNLLLISITCPAFCDEELTENSWTLPEFTVFNSFPSSLTRTSSVINSDGSFEFSLSSGTDISIRIQGSIIDINGTQTIGLGGFYRNGSFFVNFNGNGIDEFNIPPPIAPALSPKTVATLLG